MLIDLHVKNLALIEDIEVEFERGLNILTGETGAGKSVLLGSVQLILGAKTGRGMIRENAPYALVELLFQVEDERTKRLLSEMDIETEDGALLLSRRISDGKSINRINGESCTLARMKAAAALLLDIHGQHEHQSLLYRGRQLEILDAFLGSQAQGPREKVKAAYARYQQCLQELSAFETDEEKRKREISFLEFEIRQIREAALREGEDEELERTCRKLTNMRKIRESLNLAYSLTGYEQGAGELVGNACREVSKASEYDESLSSLSDILQEADSLLNDFNRGLSSYLEEASFDEETLYETEKRLDLINDMKAKYGREIADILRYLEEQEEKLAAYEHFDENRRAAEEALRKAQEELESESAALSEVRRKGALLLSEKILEGLSELNFEKPQFHIRFDRKKSFGADGYDDVEYEISTNPGEEMHPLGKIVSGGELSRIMLCIKAILADRDEIDTLIFDEIDTGISGRTAQKVSEKMVQIARHRQVICITHLPQIASMADAHFLIEKKTTDNKTTTGIHKLQEAQSVEELARLLGGTSITKAVLENAREMKDLADALKKTKD